MSKAYVDAVRLLARREHGAHELVQKLGPEIKVMILPGGQSFILGADVLGGKP